MTQEKAVAIVEDRELALREQETRFILAVKQRELLEQYIKERLKPDKHFYTVGDDPGRKPSLTKEGAELICLPHNFKPRYTVLSGPEHPLADNSPFQITVNCSLWRNQNFEGEGIGSASSHITKKDGTYQPRQKDPGLCYNATVKMAQKSAYIAATLNSTAASEFFTQDLEDDQTDSFVKSESSKEHWCEKHHTKFFKTEKMKAWAHPVKNEDGSPTLDDNGKQLWCSEPSKPKQEPKAEIKPLPDEIESPQKPLEQETSSKPGVDPEWLKETLGIIHWSNLDAVKWLNAQFKLADGGKTKSLMERINGLTPDQLKKFVEHITIMRESSGR